MKRIQYKCEVRSHAWQAEIKMFTDVYPVEAVITGRGYAFHVIYGKYANGYYLVIPEMYIGCEMAYYKDVFWNKCSLERTELSPYEIETLVQGIKQLEIEEN